MLPPSAAYIAGNFTVHAFLEGLQIYRGELRYHPWKVCDISRGITVPSLEGL